MAALYYITFEGKFLTAHGMNPSELCEPHQMQSPLPSPSPPITRWQFIVFTIFYYHHFHLFSLVQSFILTSRMALWQILSSIDLSSLTGLFIIPCAIKSLPSTAGFVCIVCRLIWLSVGCC